MFIFLRRRMLPAALLVALTGCASLSADHGFGEVSEVTKQRLGQAPAQPRSEQEHSEARDTVQKLLQQPLTADAAVQIALLNNRNLQADYQELGIAEANLVQASRLPNPGFSFGRTRSGDNLKIDRSFSMALMGLLVLPTSSKIEQRQFEVSKLTTVNRILQVAAETRSAYYQSVAANQSITYQEQVESAAAAGSELAGKMAKAGNFNQLELAREQAFHADAVTQLTRSRQQAVVAREQLIRLLGLGSAQITLQLPPRLPELPAQRPSLQDAENLAMAQRLDIAAAKLEVEGLQATLGLNQATRFINVLDLAYLHNSEPGIPHETGYQISLEIPLFDWGGARIAKSEAIYMQAAHRLAATAVDAQSQVRVAYQGYQSAYDLARHYNDQVVPLRKRVSDEYLLRYNGMLSSVFELLADAREQANAVNAAIDANRNFWLADSEMQLALGGSLPISTPAPSSSPAPAKPQGKQP
ncbi:Outer membrane protein TolC [Collimonas sp. OK607]|uniref:TolC family protein n=1 Tax=Collimonas sp. OK607 TaxID=1798194 RepID=UPI0008F04771|nr:TolC family protein [Collimonas sp. OK607]SFB29663.1 Outer membrane protein TolC [Collimonas sp. OK607]